MKQYLQDSTPEITQSLYETIPSRYCMKQYLQDSTPEIIQSFNYLFNRINATL